MYPDPVVFQAADTGDVLLSWAGQGGATGYLVYRSDCAIPPASTEAFYAGAFGRSVATFRLDADVTSVIDRPHGAAWYLVLATDGDGNLTAVDLCIEPAGARLVEAHPLASHAHTSVYENLPELVYREDDPRGRLSMYTMAHALAARGE